MISELNQYVGFYSSGATSSALEEETKATEEKKEVNETVRQNEDDDTDQETFKICQNCINFFNPEVNAWR